MNHKEFFKHAQLLGRAFVVPVRMKDGGFMDVRFLPDGTWEAPKWCGHTHTNGDVEFHDPIKAPWERVKELFP